MITDPDGVSALSFESEISISGPGTLTLDDIASEAVVGEAGYWIPASPFVAVSENLDGSYSFSDDPGGSTQALAIDDIMARYAFEWDGIVGDYTILLNTNIGNSYAYDTNIWANVPLAIDPGGWLPGDSSNFTVHIPEPTTLMLFGLAGTILLRKRRA